MHTNTDAARGRRNVVMRLPYLFTATLLATAACHGSTNPNTDVNLAVTAGNQQSGVIGAALATPLAVKATDALGAALGGIVIDWSVQSGGGSVTPTSSVTSTSGIAMASFTLGAAVGAQSVRATVNGASSSVTFAATGTAASSDPVLVATVPVPANYGHHDTFVRDGLAFVLAWNTGVRIYDVGNGVRGGSPANPMLISSLITSANGVPGGAQVHNAWWFHNPVTGEKKYLFIGQEGPGLIGNSSSGDIHVVDVSDLNAPLEVGFIRVAGAGAHNFWMDEQRQVLYAAYYTGGVIAVDVSGALAGDLSSRIIAQARPGGPGNTFVWGVMLANGTLYATDMLSGFWALDPVTLETKGGGGNVSERYSSDQWVVGPWAYSGSWGGIPRNGLVGNALKVWSLGTPGGNPTLVESIIVPNVATVSDVAVTPDGKALVITAEGGSGGAGMYVYDRVDPGHPQLRGSVLVSQGIHTGAIAVINGRTYVFAARNPSSPALLVYDITGIVP